MAWLIETQTVYIAGFPLGVALGKNITIAQSSVSSLRKDSSGELSQLQLNGGMHSGNSGGPVTDARGNVVGVSVATIRGTQINFAIPGELVQKLLEGEVTERLPGTLYSVGGKTLLPMQMRMLDPLNRVRAVNYEMWVGRENNPVPPGDRKRISKTMAKMGEQLWSADLSVPALSDPEQVYWVRAELEDAKGGKRYSSPELVRYEADLVVERKPSQLQFQPAAEVKENTLTMSMERIINVLADNTTDQFKQTYKAKAVEKVLPDARGRGTGIALRLVSPSAERASEGRQQVASPALMKQLARCSMAFLVSENNRMMEVSSTVANGIPLAMKKDLDSHLGALRNCWEMTNISFPNNRLNARETWTAHVPMMVLIEGRPVTNKLMLTCTYEGLQVNQKSPRAIIRVEGQMCSSEDTDNAVLGKVQGVIVIDPEKGRIQRGKVTVTGDVEIEGLNANFLMTTISTMNREEGNTLDP